jgi:hypothetical protein
MRSRPAERSTDRDTWKGFARDFLSKYCVRCHNEDQTGDAWRDYRLLAAVSADRTAIACGLAKSAAVRDARGCSSSAPSARQLPLGDGSKPNDDERDRMLRWIDAGLP